MTDLLARLAITEAIAREAGAYALGYFRAPDQLDISAKGLQDKVSQADKETEVLIRRHLATHFPDDGILGEEDGLTEGRSGGTWVVDPIDGTWCFINGIQSWCVAIAYVQNDEIQVGVIYDPNSGEMFKAAKGHGAFLNGRRMRMDDAADLQAGTISTGFSHRSAAEEIGPLITELVRAGGQFHRHGSGALGLAWTAAGRLIGYIEPHMNSWDCLAGLLMVREAGGWGCRFLDNNGLIDGGPVIAAGLGIQDNLTALAKKHFRLPWTIA